MLVLTLDFNNKILIDGPCEISLARKKLDGTARIGISATRDVNIKRVQRQESRTSRPATDRTEND